MTQDQELTPKLKINLPRSVLGGILWIPLLTGFPLAGWLDGAEPLDVIAAWCVFAALTWAFVGAVAGGRTLLDFWVVSVVFGFPVAFWGALVPIFIPTLTFGETRAAVNVDMVLRLIRILATVPMALAVIGSVPVGALLHRIVTHPGRFGRLRFHLAVGVRTVQRIAEVVVSLMTAWREENPRLILPRHARDWEEGGWKRAHYLKWLASAGFTWAFALAMHGLRPAPLMAEDALRVMQRTGAIRLEPSRRSQP